jgi:hypothetical protein
VIRGKSLSLSLLFVLGACANVPMAPPQATEAAADQPKARHGRYIYRGLGLAKAVDVASSAHRSVAILRHL